MNKAKIILISLLDLILLLILGFAAWSLTPLGPGEAALVPGEQLETTAGLIHRLSHVLL